MQDDPKLVKLKHMLDNGELTKEEYTRLVNQHLNNPTSHIIAESRDTREDGDMLLGGTTVLDVK